MFVSSPESLILLGTLLLCLFIGGLIIFVLTHRKHIIHLENEKVNFEKGFQLRLSEAVINSQESERKNIGNELHDEVGPLLTAVQLSLRSHIVKEPNCNLLEIKSAIINLDLAINQVRNISHVLHPAALENFGLYHAIEDFCYLINSTSACNITLGFDDNQLELEPFKTLMLYRILQELVINAIKHGNAKSIHINISANPQYFQLNIVHNGDLFTMREYLNLLETSDGLGLKNIQHRLDILNGSINFAEIETLDQRCIELRIPLIQHY
ncbi:MAG: hypothetical protein IPM92_02895 [Saprospiraceae bacterium]|nr:hypothetical protein [Saprospiraceae bacterium]